jgi:hypothetical protein
MSPHYIPFDDNDEDTVARAAELLPQHQRANFRRSVRNMVPPHFSQHDLKRCIRTVLAEYGVSARAYNYSRDKRKYDHEQRR